MPCFEERGRQVVHAVCQPGRMQKGCRRRCAAGGLDRNCDALRLWGLCVDDATSLIDLLHRCREPTTLQQSGPRIVGCLHAVHAQCSGMHAHMPAPIWCISAGRIERVARVLWPRSTTCHPRLYRTLRSLPPTPLGCCKPRTENVPCCVDAHYPLAMKGGLQAVVPEDQLELLVLQAESPMVAWWQACQRLGRRAVDNVLSKPRCILPYALCQEIDVLGYPQAHILLRRNR